MTIKRILKLVALSTIAVVLIVLAAFAYDVRRPFVTNASYVALGSSYAAGMGLGPRAPGSPFASQRSVNGYPQQLARILKPRTFTDMSSSGSTVEHVLHGGQMMLPPQIDALGPDTRLVTITAGGNDVGYIGDLMAMAHQNHGGIKGSAVHTFWKGARPVAERDFAGLERKLRMTLREIKKRSPKANIIVVTYPTVLPSRGTCASIGITGKQAELMRAVGDKLAETTRNAAAREGATIVDVAALSAGHDACSASAWVSGFQPQKGADFHPTLAGTRATAQAIARAIGSAGETKRPLD